MPADLTKSAPHILEQFVGVTAASDDVPVKAVLKFQVTSANPADTTALANASALNTATATATGVAVGDVVLGWGVVSGLATNQFVVNVYVSATDTLTFLIGNLVNSTVTTTAVVANVIVADVT